MSPWAATVLAALLLAHALHVVADVLNLRALRPGVPPELRDTFDASRHRRAQEYLRLRTRLDLTASTTVLAGTVAFWLAGGFGWLDAAIRGLGGGPVPTGLVYLAAIGLGRGLLALPFAWWATFVVEERFGFNHTTARTFWADRVKGLAIGAAVGGPLLAAVLWLFSSGVPGAWLWCWGTGALAAVVLQYAAPAWLLPLFNRFTPLPAGPLREEILACARRAGYPVDGVFVVDGSRRSTKGNAFFTGFGPKRRIALFDTLLATLDDAAIVGVVAHEIGHYRRGHVRAATAIGCLRLGGFFLLLALVLDTPALFAAFGVEPSVHVAFVVLGLVAVPLEVTVSVLLHAWSRRNEREADRFAVETTGNGLALARGLARLAADALANPTPHRLYVLLHYTHPPLVERIRALRAAAPPSPLAAARG